jgi:hypothetical protein
VAGRGALQSGIFAIVVAVRAVQYLKSDLILFAADVPPLTGDVFDVPYSVNG